MIITLIFITLFFLGLIWFISYKVVEAKYSEEADKYDNVVYNWYNKTIEERKAYEVGCEKQKAIRDKWSKKYAILNNDWVAGACAALGIVGGVVSLIIAFVIMGTHYDRGIQHKIDSFNYEKQVLEYRLEESNLEGNELLYRDVIDYNQRVRDIKYSNENPFINWFVDNDLANSIDYVDYRK